MRRSLLAEMDSDSPDSAPAWMVSYGDLMSLLLTLFVMLVSMSEIKQNDKFQGVADSLHEQFSLNQPTTGGLPGELQPRSAPLAVLAVSGREARRRVMRAPPLEASQLIAMADELAFAPGSSELRPETLNQLQVIAEFIAGKPHLVEVHGLAETTDDLELAWQRTHATARHLIDQHGIERERIQLTVVASPPPTATSGPADTSEKPMVEVFLVKESPARVASRPPLAP